MKYKEISGNNYEALNSNGETIGRIKSELMPTDKILHGIPIGDWVFVLYRIKDGEEIKIPSAAIQTLNQAKATIEYHLEKAA